MRFAYKRRGGPLLDWSGPTPPSPTRAGETRSLGELNLPRPGAPEVVSGYESPEPNAATIHLGGFIPEGAVRSYGQQMIGADPAPAKFDMGIVRKASALASAYHGAKRNNGSVLWGLLWGFAGYIAPFYGLLVPAIGVAQGFAQAKPRNNPSPSRRRTVRGKRGAKKQYSYRMKTIPATAGKPAQRKRVPYYVGPVPLHNPRRRRRRK